MRGKPDIWHHARCGPGQSPSSHTAPSGTEARRCARLAEPVKEEKALRDFLRKWSGKTASSVEDADRASLRSCNSSCFRRSRSNRSTA